eukprot:10135857-Prorocentrum_lima.AAC.1
MALSVLLSASPLSPASVPLRPACLRDGPVRRRFGGVSASAWTEEALLALLRGALTPDAERSSGVLGAAASASLAMVPGAGGRLGLPARRRK